MLSQFLLIAGGDILFNFKLPSVRSNFAPVPIYLKLGDVVVEYEPESVLKIMAKDSQVEDKILRLLAKFLDDTVLADVKTSYLNSEVYIICINREYYPLADLRTGSLYFKEF